MTKGKRSFSQSLKNSNKKTNNAAHAAKAKAELRENVLNAIGADDCHVVDAFAGDGAMYRRIWHQAAGYVGCDLVFYRDERTAFVCDNRRVLRAINLDHFNIFDLDAYGSPWEQALIVADRRKVAPGEKIGILLTEGSSLNLKMGGMPKALQVIAGLKSGIVGANRNQDAIIDLAIAGMCKRMNCKPLKRWQAKGKTGAAMRYIGLVIEGQ